MEQENNINMDVKIEENLEQEENKNEIVVKDNKSNKKKKIAIIIGIMIIVISCFYFFIGNFILNNVINNYGYYKLTFDTNGGTKVSNKIIKEGPYKLPTEVEKDGYTFIGWTVDEKIVLSPYYINEDTLFKAVWQSNESPTYYVIFNLNDGGDVDSIKVKQGRTLIKPNDPIRDGYIFDGWYLNGNLFDFNTPIEDNITLEARWIETKEELFTVTFDLNGGGKNYTKEVVSGSMVEKPTNPTRKGYKFEGWMFNGSLYSFDSIVTENITLIATWTVVNSVPNNNSVPENNKPNQEVSTPITYNVNFVSNLDATISKKVTAGSKVTAPTNTERKDFVFKGWYTDKNVLYNFNSTVNSDLTLYADWEPVGSYSDNKLDRVMSSTKPEIINNTSLLADDGYGKNLINKGIIRRSGRIYYSHNISDSLKNKTYYAVRIFNPNDNKVTLTINKCAAIMGESSYLLWSKYQSNNCSIAGKSYEIEGKRSIVIFQSGSSFVKSVNDQSGAVAIKDSFSGILDINTTSEIYVANFAFENLANTYNAAYSGTFY